MVSAALIQSQTFMRIPAVAKLQLHSNTDVSAEWLLWSHSAEQSGRRWPVCGLSWCVCVSFTDAAIYFLLFLYYSEQDLHRLVHTTTAFNCVQLWIQKWHTCVSLKQNYSNVFAVVLVADVLKLLRKQMSTTMNRSGMTVRGPLWWETFWALLCGLCRCTHGVAHSTADLCLMLSTPGQLRHWHADVVKSDVCVQTCMYARSKPVRRHPHLTGLRGDPSQTKVQCCVFLPFDASAIILHQLFNCISVVSLVSWQVFVFTLLNFLPHFKYNKNARKSCLSRAVFCFRLKTISAFGCWSMFSFTPLAEFWVRQLFIWDRADDTSCHTGILFAFSLRPKICTVD